MWKCHILSLKLWECDWVKFSVTSSLNKKWMKWDFKKRNSSRQKFKHHGDQIIRMFFVQDVTFCTKAHQCCVNISLLPPRGQKIRKSGFVRAFSFVLFVGFIPANLMSFDLWSSTLIHLPVISMLHKHIEKTSLPFVGAQSVVSTRLFLSSCSLTCKSSSESWRFRSCNVLVAEKMRRWSKRIQTEAEILPSVCSFWDGKQGVFYYRSHLMI